MQQKYADNTLSKINEPFLHPTHMLIQPGKQTVIKIISHV